MTEPPIHNQAVPPSNVFIQFVNFSHDLGARLILNARTTGVKVSHAPGVATIRRRQILSWKGPRVMDKLCLIYRIK